MRIPHLKKNNGEKKDKITIIKLEELPEVSYSPDIDFDDEKSVRRYVKSMKSSIRTSREYSKLIKFLKSCMNMNKCFFLENVRQYKGDKISIEIHHTGLVMEDIIETVLRKRYKEGEDYSFQNVAKEIMLLHYKGMISLTPLSATIHELIHAEDSQLFIPLQLCSFGDSNLFFEDYKSYMKRELVKKYETYQLMSEAFANIEDIIPDYLDVSIIYYDQNGINIPKMDAILDLMK